MGALISGAVPRLRCPEEANLRAPESVVSLHVGFIRAGAELIETNTFGANRPKLAAHFLEDEFERINSTARAARARGARDVPARDVFIAGSIGPLGDVEQFDAGDSGPPLRRAGADPRGPRRRPVHGRDVLRPRRARRRGRGGRGVSRLPIVALMTFDADGQTLGGVTRARGGRAARRRSDVAAVGANHGAGPRGRAHRARRRWPATGACSRRCRTSASRASPAARDLLPARDPRVLRRVRRAGAAASERD